MRTHSFFIFSYFRKLSLALLLLSTCASIHAADIIISPSSGSYKVGSTFSASVMLSSNKDVINAVSSDITFTTDTLELVSVSKAGSILYLWAEEPTFSNSTGKASFEGGVTNPGYSLSSGKLLSLTFRVKKEGKGVVAINSGSVLANDGSGTSVLNNTGSASFDFTQAPPAPTVVESEVRPAVVASAPVIESSSYPDSSKWYSSKQASFSWKLPGGVTAVRTLYDKNPTATPSKVYDTPITTKSFTVDDDGINYMHVQFKTASGWGAVSHKKFQVDSISPEKLEVTLAPGEKDTNVSPAITVRAVDELSGLDRVSLKVDNGEEVSYPISISDTYRLPVMTSGSHAVTVGVYDKAGNQATARIDVTVKEVQVPVITQYSKRINQGDELVVSGKAEPDTQIEVLFTKEDGGKFVGKVTADKNGAFTLVYTEDVGAGVYEMMARAGTPEGSFSAYTEGRIVVIENVKLLRIGLFVMNWLSLILIMILASMLIVGTLWYSFLQFTRFRRKIHRTIREAENTLKVNVQALRRDIEEFYTLLLKASKKRELTKEEQAIVKKLKKRLDTAEKEIEKKLESIG